MYGVLNKINIIRKVSQQPRLDVHNALESIRGFRNVQKSEEATLVCTLVPNSQSGKYFEKRGKLVSFCQPDITTVSPGKGEFL